MRTTGLITAPRQFGPYFSHAWESDPELAREVALDLKRSKFKEAPNRVLHEIVSELRCMFRYQFCTAAGMLKMIRTSANLTRENGPIFAAWIVDFQTVELLLNIDGYLWSRTVRCEDLGGCCSNL